MKKISAALLVYLMFGTTCFAITYQLYNEHFLDVGNTWNYSVHITRQDAGTADIRGSESIEVSGTADVNGVTTKTVETNGILGYSKEYCAQEANYILEYKEEEDDLTAIYTNNNPTELYPVYISTTDNDLHFSSGNLAWEQADPDITFNAAIDCNITYLRQEQITVVAGTYRCIVVYLKATVTNDYYGYTLVAEETDWIEPQVGIIKSSYKDTISDGQTNTVYDEYTHELTSTNIGAGEYDVAPEPIMSLDGGTFLTPPQLRLSCEVDDVNIYYTLDGTEPSANSTLFDGNAMTVEHSCTVKAKGVKDGYMDSNAVSAKFVISPAAYRQDKSSYRIISIEAEKYANNISTDYKSWVKVSSPAGASCSYSMQALPDSGDAGDYPKYLTSSPRLDYAVNFVSSGTYYVWIRGYATSGTNDSVHVGLDNAPNSSSDRISGFTSGKWSWSRKTMDGPVATVSIQSPGPHILNVWMREDGFRIDKIVLTTNANYVPTGSGPAHTLYYQESSSGLVQMEAENYNSRAAQGGRDWKPASSPAGCSNGYAMQALADTGACYDGSKYLTSSPRLDFTVNFVKTGKHYVWVRGYVTSGTNDSVHAGLDNALSSSSDKLTGFALKKWSWSRKTMDGPYATINVKSTGIHTFNIWMREDGFRIDKIVITTSSSYVPSP